MEDTISRIEHQDKKSSESIPDYPEMKSPSTPSVKRSKRGIQKRVVSVPMKDVEGSHKSKSDTAAPPSDSWAWRKYGQKPIKGSPYPRGYYRCSSYKGCPARKQVERSKADPSMLMITYSFEHNHSWPLPMRNHHQNSPKLSSSDKKRLEPAPLEEPLHSGTAGEDEFCWFDGMETVHSSVIHSSLFLSSAAGDMAAGLSVIFPQREEDDSLFADLGELPECSAVFGHHPGADTQMQIC